MPKPHLLAHLTGSFFMHDAMPRPIQATIHPAALRHNLARVRQAAPDAQVWAVVKANAYGHGIERVFDGLRGADGFALLDLDEASRVRALGWRGPILLLEGIFEARDLELCSRLGLWHTAQDARAAPRVPQDEFGHEPPGLCARALPRRLDAPERPAAGG
jgi:alanine racemase